MSQPVMKVFDQPDVASQARDALLASGFDPSIVELQARDDEAGPVEGNFVCLDHDAKPRVFHRCTLLLTVGTTSEDEARRASAILRDFNACAGPRQ
ncbi:MAG: hypothetical protein JWP36_1750 [Paucimonas sp.]|nr:hypothetical protein [Paucimonas sp.]